MGKLILHSVRRFLSVLLLAAASVPNARGAEGASERGYPQTPHSTANLALLMAPEGSRQPVERVAAQAPYEASETTIENVTGASSFPLESYEANPAMDGGNCEDCAADGTNGMFASGTYFEPSCAPHDPRQPHCRWTDDSMWGCGGSPFRHGPGKCDTWRVGPVWDVAVDGAVLHREDANLAGIIAATDVDSFGDPQSPTFTNDFDYGPGGRLSITGKVPRWKGYRIQVGYEGIEEWNASVIYPKFFFDPLSPPDPLDVPFASEQRRVHYRSSMHTAEINFVRCYDTSNWQPYCGVRYVKFDDEISDFIDQESQAPLPSPDAPHVITTDQLNLFDLENNMIGFQIGVKRDLWKISRRFSIQGFVNGGVYHNEAKRTNFMSFTTVEQFADDTDSLGDQGRVEVRQTANNEVSEIADIAYLGEASITGVCRLNRCCALRAGYQVLWIDGLRLAEDAFLTGDDISRDLLFYGWHAGFEYRR